MRVILWFTLLAASLISAESIFIESHLENKLLHSTSSKNATANIIITMTNGTKTILDQISTQRFANRKERLNTLKTNLQNHAKINQEPILNVLNVIFPKLKEIQSFWISNQIYIKNANKPILTLLKLLPGIAKIELEKIMYLNTTFVEKLIEHCKPDNELTYGIKTINADKVWKLGFSGENVVVANIDSGVNKKHITLKDRWRSDYGWFNPFTCPEGMPKLCGSQSPVDDNGHGTHTMGTICGSNGIGVAPNATWIACKACDLLGSCSQSDITRCGQWIACPTRSNGTDHDCSKAAHVVNNSWGGGQNQTWYNSIIEAWTSGRILHTFSAGNSGEDGCGSANSPADQDEAFSIGATDEDDKLAPFSSLGPALNTNLIKPDIVAPGTDVISASHIGHNKCATHSGTSMAAPHISGVMALMKSKNPDLTQEQARDILINSAVRTGLIGIGEDCGGKREDEFPNNSFGSGRVDALNAVNSVKV